MIEHHPLEYEEIMAERVARAEAEAPPENAPGQQRPISKLGAVGAGGGTGPR